MSKKAGRKPKGDQLRDQAISPRLSIDELELMDEICAVKKSLGMNSSRSDVIVEGLRAIQERYLWQNNEDLNK